MSTQLPAHLLALFNAHPDIAQVGANIKNDSFAKIRYAGSKWKLIKATGEEINVTTPYLDVIVVGVNEHKSHVVYNTAYDPKGDAQAPVWQSDDGTPVPVEHETKVVSDFRRLAVVSAENIDGEIYELRISAGSLTNVDKYISALRNHGAPVTALVTRVTFDPAETYPKLVFTPTAYIDEKQAVALSSVLDTGKRNIAVAIGTARQEQAALSAPAPVAHIAAPVESQTEAPARRTRTKKEEPVPVASTSFEAPGLNGFSMPSVVQSAAAATVITPQPTNAALNNLLANVLKL